MPELLDQIASFGHHQDNVSLALVSHSMYFEAIRFVWRVLSTPLPLLKLFHGIRLSNGQWVRLNSI